jgi:hypothetical protein
LRDRDDDEDPVVELPQRGLGLEVERRLMVAGLAVRGEDHRMLVGGELAPLARFAALGEHVVGDRQVVGRAFDVVRKQFPSFPPVGPGVVLEPLPQAAQEL